MNPTPAELLRLQAHYCELLGSPLYAHLLERAAEDVEEGGPTSRALAGHADDPPNSMLPLRLLGAAHRLVLAGEAPGLARFYPSAGGDASDLDGAWRAFCELLGEKAGRIEDEIGAPVQTNEVGRSAALLGGFLLVAERFGQPLRMLEVGASAGLILGWDRFRYEAGGRGWGPEGASVRFAAFLDGSAERSEFPFDVRATVADRSGCDAHPLDPASERDRQLLRSFLWADHVERFETLSAALEEAAGAPVEVEQADAADWVERKLERLPEGVATVLYHSMVLMFLSDASRERMLAAIARAGERASEQAPFAWLRMELGGDEADVHLTVWPDGRERRIARAGYHGRPVRWLPS